jgi:1-deoxy-D-xylulose-5-phosphate synthase
VLQALRSQPGMKLLHVLTVKGKGVKGCEEDPLALHGAKPGDQLALEGDAACKVDKVEAAPTPIAVAAKKSAPKVEFARCFSEVLLAEAQKEPRICAITAGMPDGTGLKPFAEKLPDRFFNVGIAEQHAVAFASGLTIAGRRPVCAIYSTFLQRGFDQVFQEVALQGLPVRFCMDRAGLVGGDGAVHHGFLDVAYLRGFPGMALMAAMDEASLRAAMELMRLRDDGPSAVRYPRDSVPAREGAQDPPPFELGKAALLAPGEDLAILAYGFPANHALEARTALARDGLSVAVWDARFAKPVDAELLERLVGSGIPVLTVEDHHRIGGFGSAVLETCHELGLPTQSIHRLGLPDRWIYQGSRSGQLAEAGIDADSIAKTVRELLRQARRARVSA